MIQNLPLSCGCSIDIREVYSRCLKSLILAVGETHQELIAEAVIIIALGTEAHPVGWKEQKIEGWT